ncbi:MAG: hypothetical protein GW778_01920 [Alphaproteobacteria bacterium]|nr:hypothetical protein [Alphaproteobacteria bacterium]
MHKHAKAIILGCAVITTGAFLTSNGHSANKPDLCAIVVDGVEHGMSNAQVIKTLESKDYTHKLHPSSPPITELKSLTFEKQDDQNKNKFTYRTATNDTIGHLTHIFSSKTDKTKSASLDENQNVNWSKHPYSDEINALMGKFCERAKDNKAGRCIDQPRIKKMYLEETTVQDGKQWTCRLSIGVTSNGLNTDIQIKVKDI